MMFSIDKLVRKCDQLKLEVECTEHKTAIISLEIFNTILDDMERLIKDIKQTRR